MKLPWGQLALAICLVNSLWLAYLTLSIFGNDAPPEVASPHVQPAPELSDSAVVAKPRAITAAQPPAKQNNVVDYGEDIDFDDYLNSEEANYDEVESTTNQVIDLGADLDVESYEHFYESIEDQGTGDVIDFGPDISVDEDPDYPQDQGAATMRFAYFPEQDIS